MGRFRALLTNIRLGSNCPAVAKALAYPAKEVYCTGPRPLVFMAFLSLFYHLFGRKKCPLKFKLRNIKRGGR